MRSNNKKRTTIPIATNIKLVAQSLFPIEADEKERISANPATANTPTNLISMVVPTFTPFLKCIE